MIDVMKRRASVRLDESSSVTPAYVRDAMSAAAKREGSLSSTSNINHDQIVSGKAWGSSAKRVVLPAPAGAEIRIRGVSSAPLVKTPTSAAAEGRLGGVLSDELRR